MNKLLAFCYLEILIKLEKSVCPGSSHCKKKKKFSDLHASPSSRRQKNSLLLVVLRWYQGHELRVYEQTTGNFSNNWQKECLNSNTFKSKKLFGKKVQKFILYLRIPFGKLNIDQGVQFILKFSMENSLARK